MKRLTIIITWLFFLYIGCVGTDSKQTVEKSDIITLDTISDTLSSFVEEQEIISQAEIVYPHNIEEIKRDMLELVKMSGQGEDFEGYPDSINVDTTDMQSLVKYLVKSKYEWLKDNFSDGEPSEIPLCYEFNVYVLDDTAEYLTLAVKEATLYGGPGPRLTSYGITYLKPDGKKIGVKDLNSSKTDEIKNELQKKVESYIAKLIEGEDFKVDDVLYYKNGTLPENQFDFPYNGLYIDGDSVVFPYQSEELTARTFGTPEVKLSLRQMKAEGWLGKSLSDIIK